MHPEQIQVIRTFCRVAGLPLALHILATLVWMAGDLQAFYLGLTGTILIIGATIAALVASQQSV